MYVLEVSYTQAPEQVVPHMPSHGAWVRKHLEDGTFLAAGPKKSGLGGVILARSMPRAQLRAVLAEDSFVREDVADYRISDFDAKAVADSLLALREA